MLFSHSNMLFGHTGAANANVVCSRWQQKVQNVQNSSCNSFFFQCHLKTNAVIELASKAVQIKQQWSNWNDWTLSHWYDTVTRPHRHNQQASN